MGNPCAKFEGYKEFVLATLPNLKSLDGEDLTRGDKIQAEQMMKSGNLR